MKAELGKKIGWSTKEKTNSEDSSFYAEPAEKDFMDSVLENIRS